MQRIFIALLAFLTAPMLNAHEGIRTGPDSHAPIGMSGDHTHKTDEVMWSYRYSRMEMDELVEGTNTVSRSDVLSRYAMAPVGMESDMHMMGAMYAPSDTVTLALMLGWTEKEMTMVGMGGTSSRSKSRGIGDTKLSALYSLPSSENQSLHLNFSVSAPTGSIDETSTSGGLLGYSMQLGSGTWDVTGGITWRGMADRFSWGTQVLTTTRFGTNDRNYTLGDNVVANGWSAWRWNDNWSTSLRLQASHMDRIDGSDSTLNPMMSPGMDASVSGGDELAAGIGANYRVSEGALTRHRLAIELVKPLYQDLNGPRLASDWTFTVGWQYDFSL